MNPEKKLKKAGSKKNIKMVKRTRSNGWWKFSFALHQYILYSNWKPLF